MVPLINIVIEAFLFISSSIIIGVAIYNLAIATIGLFGKKIEIKNFKGVKFYPRYSLIVPVKLDENYLPRLLDSINNVEYPKNLIEVIIIVASGSTKNEKVYDRLIQMVKAKVKLVKDGGMGKNKALNIALKHATGDILAFFDADSVIGRDTLSKAAECFADPTVSAVQGSMSSINRKDSIITCLSALEEDAFINIVLKSRSSLNLFLPLLGSCMFIRREIMNRLGGWSEEIIAEDAELSVRLLLHHIKVAFRPEVNSLHESPFSVKAFFRQRLRWFYGYFQILRRIPLGRISIQTLVDLLAFFSGPLFLALSFLIMLSIPFYILLIKDASVMIITLIFFPIALTTASIFVLVCLNKMDPREIVTVILFIIPYWIFESFTALVALIKFLFRIKQEWEKTPKKNNQ